MNVLIKKIGYFVLRIIVYFIWIFPIKNKRIFITSFGGRGYGDNQKYICKEILKSGIDAEIIWAVRNNVGINDFPKRIKIVKYWTPAFFYYMGTSKIWIDNSRKPSWVEKRRKQFYIQTWHGGTALKKIEKDAEGKLGRLYEKNAKHDSEMIDIMISNGRFCTEMYIRAFWYKGKIAEYGSPRADILLKQDNNKLMSDIKKKIGVCSSKKIVLYAPTFRDNGSLSTYNIDYERLVNNLKLRFNSDWVILFRLHPNLVGKINIKPNPYTIDVSKYSDIYELMLISDCLITDYSSVMFEMMLTKKPVFLYASDIDDYIQERGLYFNFSDLPFSVATNNLELEENIIHFQYDDYTTRVNSFIHKLGIKEDGNASKRICALVKRVLKLHN